MSKLFFILFYFLNVLMLSAQVDVSDSLKKAMVSYASNDTIQVKRMKMYALSLPENRFNEALEVFSDAIKLAKSIGWESGLVGLYIRKSDIESRQEKYDASIISLLAAQKIAEDNHLNTGILYAIEFNLSESYRLMGDFANATIHAKKSVDFTKKLGNDDYTLDAFALLGGVYAENNQWDSAAPLLEKAMQIAVSKKNEYMEQQIISHRAEYLFSIKDFDGALKQYRPNMLYQLKTENKNGIAWVYSVMSKIFTGLNIKDSSIFYGDMALKVAKKYGLVKELKDAYDALFVSHNAFGDYKLALQYRLLYDSIYNSTFTFKLGQNAEKAKNELGQQRKEALAQAEKNKKDAEASRTKNILFGAILLFALIGGFLFWNNRQKQKANAKIEKAYSELKSTQSQLVQSEKMASLGELTAGIAHEIQNPLNFVNNFSEVNKELLIEIKDELDKGNTDEAKSIANDVIDNEEKINHHGKRADAIVKGMLQHSRSSNGVKEPTDINALCDEYLRLSYHGLRAKDKSFNATIKTDFDKSIEKINIIPQDFGRVMLNLLNNAFYAVDEKKKLKIPLTPEGGTLASINVAYEPTVTVTTRRLSPPSGGWGAEITVSDNGNGIPSSVKEKIFQPFFTTKPTGQGTGLGLSLSYDIIKSHGGELKVETKENEARPDDPVGRGTTFTIQLPIA